MEQNTQHVGRQFNGQEATAAHACLLAANIQASIEGLGRALDNVFRQRLSRSVNYDTIYLIQYDTVRQLQTGLTAYFDFISHERPHPPKCPYFSHSVDQTLGPTIIHRRRRGNVCEFKHIDPPVFM